MGKTITLSDTAYSRLAKHKRPGETFSDVVVDMIPEPSATVGELLANLRRAYPAKRAKNRRHAAA